MEYTILQLAKLAGVSTRTLRYYDQIGLLKPVRLPESGYRIYGSHEADVLQQILFYKRMGIGLTDIREILANPEFDSLRALKTHLARLEAEEQNIRLLIDTVKKTIEKEEGKSEMTDEEKFVGLKKQMIRENEEKYGKEIRDKYGEAAVEESNRKMMNLSSEEYNAMQKLAEDILDRLFKAVTGGLDASGEEGREIAMMHKKWLGYTWTSYSAASHRGLTDMYLADERFRTYYDSRAEGCAGFLRDAVHCHIN